MNEENTGGGVSTPFKIGERGVSLRMSGYQTVCTSTNTGALVQVGDPKAVCCTRNRGKALSESWVSCTRFGGIIGTSGQGENFQT